jgi:hypothetical protein
MPTGRPKKRGEASKPAAANGASVNKLGAVRDLLRELGPDIRPLALKDKLKERYNIVMDAAYVSKYKSLALSQLRKEKRRGRAPQAAGAQPAPAPVMKSARAAGGDLSLQDIRTIKELSGRLGAAKVCELVDLVAR